MLIDDCYQRIYAIPFCHTMVSVRVEGGGEGSEALLSLQPCSDCLPQSSQPKWKGHRHCII